MPLLHLFHALVGSYLRHEAGRTLLTVLGIALGVGVLAAIDLANESAVESFRSTVEDVAGSAQLEVRGNGIGLPPETVARVAAVPGVAGLSPLITGDFLFPAPEDGTATETLTLLGVDLLRSGEPEDRPVRDIRFSLLEGLAIQDFLTRDDLLILTERFARRHSLEPGDAAQFHFAGLPRRMVVGGVVDAGPFADALNGNVAVVDISVADILLRRGGLLDRIDVMAEEGADTEALAARLAALPGPSLLVERPRARSARVDGMLAAFRFNLRALGHISILAGAFLVFNTMSISVLRRRPVIGTLRAMGVRKGEIRGVFLLEGALFGLAGSILGMAGGMVAAGFLLHPLSEAISINFVRVRPSGIIVNTSILMQALFLGVGGSLLAALLPASEAANTPPANTMRRGTEEQGAARWPWRPLVGGLLLALLALPLLLREPRAGLPIGGYIASVLLVGGFAFWARPILALVCTALRRPWALIFGAEGLLAVAATRASLARSTVAVCGLLVSIAMTISVTVMVSSFRTTVTSWMEQVLTADFYIAPIAGGADVRTEPMPPGIAARIAALPGVAAVDPFRSWEATLNGLPVRIGSGDFTVPRFTSRSRDGRPMPQALGQARENRAAIVSEAFAMKQGLGRGDVISLPTPRGDRALPIEAVYTDYSSEQGFVIFDRGLLLEWFDDHRIDSVTVHLEPGADRAALRAAIGRIAADDDDIPPLSIQANEELRASALSAFDRTFAVTNVLKIIAILVSILGVTTTLLSQVLDRRHEISTLRHLGAWRARIARLILLETVLIVLTGILLGIPAGLMLSWILTRVIMLESFGWTIEFAIPWLLTIQTALIIFLGSLVAAVLPAREAIRNGGVGSSASGR